MMDKSKLSKDDVIGEKRIRMYEVIKNYNGKCEKLEINLDIMSE
jgi:hypothetical protein